MPLRMSFGLPGPFSYNQRIGCNPISWLMLLLYLMFYMTVMMVWFAFVMVWYAGLWVGKGCYYLGVGVYRGSRWLYISIRDQQRKKAAK